MNREELLHAYLVFDRQASNAWETYLQTERPQAFGEYLAACREVDAVYLPLVSFGMTLEDIRAACSALHAASPGERA